MPTPVPSLSMWALMLLAACLGVTGIGRARKQR
ncbi:IPTL-CTERM sorting domain-containing protein [uncultured Comamonas sp.]